MKRSHFAIVAGALACGIAWAAMAGDAQSCPLQAQVAPTRLGWALGEPVEIRVRLDNRGNQPATIALAYPWLIGQGSPGIAFSLTQSRPVPDYMTNAIARVTEIAARSHFDVHVYANRYLPNLGAGNHKVYWWFDIDCLDARGALQATGKFQGSFTIRIGDRPRADAAALADAYVERLRAPDYQVRLEAREALVNMWDPAVLPALEKLFRLGDSSEAFEALGKFDGNPAAARVLVDILTKGDAIAARNAFKVAHAWRSDLPTELLDELAREAGQPAKLELIGYLGARRSAAHDALLRKLATAPDEAVARAAQATLAKPPQRR